MAFTGEKHLLSAPLGWLERLTYKLGGVYSIEKTNWKTYAFGFLTFNFIGFLNVFILHFRHSNLLLNPDSYQSPITSH